MAFSFYHVGSRNYAQVGGKHFQPLAHLDGLSQIITLNFITESDII